MQTLATSKRHAFEFGLRERFPCHGKQGGQEPQLGSAALSMLCGIMIPGVRFRGSCSAILTDHATELFHG